MLSLWTVRLRKVIPGSRGTQGVNSGARASTMRGRVGVIFHCVGFESHRRNRESRCSPMATLSILDPEVVGSIPAGCASRFLGFPYLLFAFRREVAHLTWPRSFAAVGEYSNSPLFSPFGFPR